MEVKGGDFSIVPLLVDVVAKCEAEGFQPNLVWIGFDLELMKLVKESFPSDQVYHVSKLRDKQKPMEEAKALIDAAAAAGLDGIDLQADRSTVTAPIIHYAHWLKLEVLAFDRQNDFCRAGV